jgi:hypothetical protein
MNEFVLRMIAEFFGWYDGTDNWADGLRRGTP